MIEEYGEEGLEPKTIPKKEFQLEDLVKIPPKFKVDKDLKRFTALFTEEKQKYQMTLKQALKDNKNEIFSWNPQIDGSLTFGQIDSESEELDGVGTKVDDMGNIVIGIFKEGQFVQGLVFIKSAKVMISNLSDYERSDYRGDRPPVYHQFRYFDLKVSGTRFKDEYFSEADGIVEHLTLREYLTKSGKEQQKGNEFLLKEYKGHVVNYKRNGQGFALHGPPFTLVKRRNSSDDPVLVEAKFKNNKLDGPCRVFFRDHPHCLSVYYQFNNGAFVNTIGFYSIRRIDQANQRLALSRLNIFDPLVSPRFDFAFDMRDANALCLQFYFPKEKNSSIISSFPNLCYQTKGEYNGIYSKPVIGGEYQLKSSNFSECLKFEYCFLGTEPLMFSALIKVTDLMSKRVVFEGCATIGNEEGDLYSGRYFGETNYFHGDYLIKDLRIESTNKLSLVSPVPREDILSHGQSIPFSKLRNQVAINKAFFREHCFENCEHFETKLAKMLGYEPFIKRGMIVSGYFYAKRRAFYMYQDPSGLHLFLEDDDITIFAHEHVKFKDRSPWDCEINFLKGKLEGVSFKGLMNYQFSCELQGLYSNQDQSLRIEFETVGEYNADELSPKDYDNPEYLFNEVKLLIDGWYLECSTDGETIQKNSKIPRYQGTVKDSDGTVLHKGDIRYKRFNMDKSPFYLSFHQVEENFNLIPLNFTLFHAKKELNKEDDVYEGELRYSNPIRRLNGQFELFEVQNDNRKLYEFDSPLLQVGEIDFKALDVRLKIEKGSDDKQSKSTTQVEIELNLDQVKGKIIDLRPPALGDNHTKTTHSSFIEKGLLFSGSTRGVACAHSYSLLFFDSILIQRDYSSINTSNKNLLDSIAPTKVELTEKGKEFLNDLFDQKFNVNSVDDLQVQVFYESYLEVSLLISPKQLLTEDHYTDDSFLDQYDRRLRKSYRVKLHSNGRIERGDFNLNALHGKGEITFEKESPIDSIKSEEFRASTPCGICEVTYKSGAVYKGAFRLDKRHGTGALNYPNGDKYEGDFYLDRPHGNGVYSWNGSQKAIFEGEFKCGEISGKGKLIPQESKIYLEGVFVGGVVSAFEAKNSLDSEELVDQVEVEKLKELFAQLELAKD